MLDTLKRIIVVGFAVVFPIVAEEPAAEVTFSAPEHRANEASGALALQVIRTGVTTNAVSVDYSLEPITATPEEDYTPATGTLAFAEGQTTATILVAILNDAVLEPAETLRVTLANPSAGTSLGAHPVASVAIEDNDHPAGIDDTFNFAPNAYFPPDEVFAIKTVLALDGSTVFYAGTNNSAAPTIGLVDINGTGLRTSGLREYNDGVRDIDGSFYLAGHGFNGVLSWYSGKLSYDSAFGVPQRAGLSGAGNVIRLTTDRRLLVGGTFFQGSDTNLFGLARLFRNGARDESFATNEFSGREVTALAIDGDAFYAASVSTNESSEVSYNVARYLADGTRDAAFAQVQLDGRIEVLQIMPGGDLLAGGSFTEAGDEPHAHLVRLSSSGEVVPTSQSASPDGPVYALAIEPNGQWLIAGAFNQIGGAARIGLARLTPEGELDLNFDAGVGPNAPILSLAVQPDGRIIVAGAFTEFSGKASHGLVRLNGGTIPEAAYLYWDRAFSTVQEQAGSADISLVRSGGTSEALTVSLDVAGGSASLGLDFEQLPPEITFEPGQTQVDLAISLVRDALPEDRETIILQLTSADESLLITRGLTEVRIQDAESPASRDTTFALDTLQRPGAIAVQEDGKFLISSNSGLTRLHPDGTLDETFRADVFTNMSPGGTIIGILPADDKIYVYGSFALIQGGLNLAHILRLEQDGTLDSAFRPTYSTSSALFTGLSSIVPQPGGSLLVSGFGLQTSIERLSPQGARDRFYGPPPALRSVAVNQLIMHPGGGFVVAGDNLPLAWLDETGRTSTNLAPALTGSARHIQPFRNGFLVGGELYHVPTETSHRLVLLTQDGTLDASFHVDVNGPVNQALPLESGKILISGNFTHVDGMDRNRIARLHPDGSLDTTFDPGLGLDAPANILAETSEGKLLVGGWNHAHYDGEPVPDLIRLTDAPPQQPPSIEIISPENGATFNAGESIPVQIEGFDPEGVLAKVKLLVNGQVQYEFDAPPYETSLVLEPGTYALQAEATDAAGLTTLSPEVEIQVQELAVPIEITFAPSTAGEWEIAVPSRTGATYTLQTSQDLVSWSDAAQKTASADSVQFPISLAAEGHLFYRVVETP